MLFQRQRKVFPGTLRLFVLLLGGLSLYAQDKAQILEYRHDLFSIQFPVAWQLSESGPGYTVMSVCPKTGSRDPFQERVSVVYDNLGRRTLAQYVDLNVRALRTNLVEVQILSNGPKSHGGNEGIEVELTHQSAGTRTAMRIFFVEGPGNLVFIIICAGQGRDYTRLQDMFDTIVASFAPLSRSSGETAARE